MKWLCVIGLHAFRPFAFNSVVNPIAVERCDRCGVGRQWNIAGFTVRYSREQMDEAAAKLNENARRQSVER